MIEKIKIPAIAGGITFVLFFIINIIVGNGFFTIFLRALISSAIVFGMIMGLIFLYEKYLTSEMQMSDMDNKSEDQNVDILLDDEEGEEASEVKDNINNNEETQFSFDSNFESTGDLDNVEVPITAKEELVNKKTDMGNDNFSDDFIKNDSTGELNLDDISANIGKSDDNYSFDGDDTNSYNNEESSEQPIDYSEYKGKGDGKTLKDKIGFDVSYDDVAKAIRTKFKEE
jgi:hypothetical protein